MTAFKKQLEKEISKRTSKFTKYFLKCEKWCPCNILDKEVNLNSIYHSELFRFLRHRSLADICEDCTFRDSCKGGFITRATLNAGNINEPDDYCPVKNNLLVKVNQIKSNIKKSSSEKLIHEGYLCTTIMKPL